ncbi:flavin-binding monooxygenase-like family protein [Stagonosporopsis vannaccii]|nr:flavin-binding monooxygenase-like family protein [Stagonosporopsis vannaccii]
MGIIDTSQEPTGQNKAWKSLEVDAERLAAKYKEEREKRLKKDGINQYQHAVESSLLLPMTDDPFADSSFTRDPVTKDVDIVIIGGGVGGLLVACNLVKAGHENILIIEKGGDFGGVWYWNRYPGIQIDIESYIYMPLLEDVGYVPSRKYSPGPEIYEYLKKLARHFGLYDKVLFQTEVLEMRWDKSATKWRISTSRQDNITAGWLVPSTGPFNEPKFPGIQGIETFKGHQFHSSRWDFDYTGGDSSGGLTKLADKRVGIIGTGATGIQIIPHLGESSKQLVVFQRTPSSIDVRGNRSTDAEWFKSQKPGWITNRIENFTRIIGGLPTEVDLVDDGWTRTVASLSGWFGDVDRSNTSESPEETARRLQLADYKKMQSIRNRVDEIVKDPGTAESLKPYFNQFCKRPCFHDDYLPTFNRPNVQLVDTQGKGVDRITEKGIVANGIEYELDCIVYATGFEYASDWHIRHHANIYGEDGVSITEKWKEGPVTLHGWAVNGFPNIFFISSAQTSGVANYHHSLVEQGKHLIYVINKWKNSKIAYMDADAKAEDEWVAEVIRASKGRAEYLKACTPGYYNDEGQVSDTTAKNNPYGGGVDKFLQLVSNWRVADTLEGMRVTYAN